MKNVVFPALCLGLLIASPASAQEWGHSFSPSEARDAVRDGRSLPLSQILKALKQRHGGYHLSAELFSSEGGGAEYHIDWMTEDGRKIVFIIDARSGRVLEERGA